MAIKPVGKCRSELEISQSLSQILNRLEPGICSFPEERKPEVWFQSFTPWLKTNVGISDYRELHNGAHPLISPVQEEGTDLGITPSGKYNFMTLEAFKAGMSRDSYFGKPP